MAEAKKKVEATKPTPEEKQAAAEAEVDALVARAKKALVEFENLDQKQVDRIVAKASIAALNKHLVLAKMAVDETGRGLVEDKATKNIFACEHVTNYLAGQKTVGIIREDDVMGIDEVAEPVGVVAGVTPVTNPTSTRMSAPRATTPPCCSCSPPLPPTWWRSCGRPWALPPRRAAWISYVHQ